MSFKNDVIDIERSPDENTEVETKENIKTTGSGVYVERSNMFRLSTLSKMSFREEAVKYFCRTSCRSGQSRTMCLTVNGTSQDAHVGWSSPESRISVSSESDQFFNRLILLLHEVKWGYCGTQNIDPQRRFHLSDTNDTWILGCYAVFSSENFCLRAYTILTLTLLCIAGLSANNEGRRKEKYERERQFGQVVLPLSFKR